MDHENHEAKRDNTSTTDKYKTMPKKMAYTSTLTPLFKEVRKKRAIKKTLPPTAQYR